jgi:hypothetical protein
MLQQREQIQIRGFKQTEATKELGLTAVEEMIFGEKIWSR